jgi:hypothetical protein
MMARSLRASGAPLMPVIAAHDRTAWSTNRGGRADTLTSEPGPDRSRRYHQTLQQTLQLLVLIEEHRNSPRHG